MEDIRSEMADDPIWMQVDETTDASGKFIANVIVGSLRKDGSSKSHLLASKELTATNSASITQMVLDCFRKFK